MAKTAPGSLSRGLEFEIIGDYTHPSPFLQKKRKKEKEICLIPLSGAASEGAQGRLASITGLKKAQNIRNQEEPWPRLAGKKASWPANKRCWVWSGRGRRHLAVDHSGQWGHRWPAGLRVELSWKMGGGGAGSSVLTLDSELQPNAAGLSFQPRPRRLWQPWLTALRAAYLTQSHPPSLFWRISSSGHSQII